MRKGRAVQAVALLVVGAVALAACGSKVKTTAAPKTSYKPCGTVNLAVNAWVGYEAHLGEIPSCDGGTAQLSPRRSSGYAVRTILSPMKDGLCRPLKPARPSGACTTFAGCSKT